MFRPVIRCAFKSGKGCSLPSKRAVLLGPSVNLPLKPESVTILTSYRLQSTSSKSSSKTIATKVTIEQDGSSKEIIPKDAKVGPPKPSLWTRIKHEIRHYKDGTKLLGLEIKISFRLLLKLSAGYELTRREMLQLKRTTQDIIRLVPFAAFVLVPFAELLLPIALKLFPNLLPSTYESNKDKESKLDRLRKSRKVMAGIIKGEISHFKPINISDEQKAVFNKFYEHVRKTGEPESRKQLIQVARLFTDDTVLDNVTRPYLVALAKYMNLQPFGTDVMLRYRIRYKMMQLKKDDLSIYYEGVDQLNPAELFNICSSRGIKCLNVDDTVLRDTLRIWLNMRLKDKIPSTLLIMATAYNYGEITSKKSLYDALCDVISAIPDELYHEVKVNVVKEDTVSAKQKLVQLKEQEEIMREEEQQEKNSIVRVKDQLCLDELDKQEPSAISQPKSDPDSKESIQTQDVVINQTKPQNIQRETENTM